MLRHFAIFYQMTTQKYGLFARKTLHLAPESYTLHTILHAILHPKSAVCAGISGYPCRMCRQIREKIIVGDGFRTLPSRIPGDRMPLNQRKSPPNSKNLPQNPGNSPQNPRISPWIATGSPPPRTALQAQAATPPRCTFRHAGEGCPGARRLSPQGGTPASRTPQPRRG